MGQTRGWFLMPTIHEPILKNPVVSLDGGPPGKAPAAGRALPWRSDLPPPVHLFRIRHAFGEMP